MLRRVLLACALLTVAVLGVGGPAQALDVTTRQATNELDVVRTMLQRSLVTYQDHHEDEAYTLARNAYLDHFELVEIPLRVRDEALTFSLEEKFAGLRNDIQDHARLSRVRAQVGDINDGLDAAERALSKPGIGAPLLAFVFSFITLFREGFEAVLVVAAILGFLASSRNEQYRGAILKGVGAAGAATVLVFVAATWLIRIAPFQREMLEAGTTILATVVLFFVSFWLFRRLDHRRWMEFLSAKVWAAGASGSALALVGVGFTAVFREGFETVLFYQALLFVAKGIEIWVAAGAAAALVVLVGLAFAIFRAGRRLPTKKFLGIAVGLLMALSVAFAGNAARGLQTAALIPLTVIHGAPRLPIFLAELTGYHPTVQTVLAQAVLASIYVVGGLVVAMRARRRRASGTRSATNAAVPEREPADRS